jgi:hypothetical protein
LNKSLEDWVNQQLEHYVPGIILDHRTNLQAKLSFLRGQDARFWLKGASLLLLSAPYLFLRWLGHSTPRLVQRPPGGHLHAGRCTLRPRSER